MPFHIERNDITKMRVDAIVNAANTGLRMGGGVCGSIFHAAGPTEMIAACEKIGGCATGEAVATPGFALPARYVIHTPGPVWKGGQTNEQALLRSCYLSSLRLAASMKLKSIAFPLISGGIYGYPRKECVKTAVDAIGDFLIHEDADDLEVTLVLYGSEAFMAGTKLFGDIRSYVDEQSVLKEDLAQQRRRRYFDEYSASMIEPLSQSAHVPPSASRIDASLWESLLKRRQTGVPDPDEAA